MIWKLRGYFEQLFWHQDELFETWSYFQTKSLETNEPQTYGVRNFDVRWMRGMLVCNNTLSLSLYTQFYLALDEQIW